MDKSKLDRIILASCVSTSGKWQLLLCEHIVAGRFCYDVVGFCEAGGFSVSRHYREALEDSVNKAEALRIFDDYREKLTAPAVQDEETERMIIVEPN
jgi:hypothetical protein